MQEIKASQIESAMAYEEYVNLLDQLMAEGKTTGEDQSEKMVHYAGLNQQRMKRISKTFNPSDKFRAAASSLDRSMIWLVLTEGWCGDAAQNLPILNSLHQLFPQVELRLLLRDQNLELMDQFLTNGGRSIPKLIALDAETHEVLDQWGPRPDALQQLVLDFKKVPNGNYEEFTKEVHLWYAKDKGRSTEQEILDMMKKSQ